MPEQTLADNLQRLTDTVPAIGNAIIAKGGTVGANDGLEEFAADIMSIKNDLTSIDITENGTYYSGDETVVTSSAFPIVINDSNGTPVRHVDINGNAVQSGIPTPDNPIIPQGVCERTGNLYDKSQVVLGKEIDGLTYMDSPKYFITGFIPVEGGKTYYKSNSESSILLYYNADYEEIVTKKLSVQGVGYFTIPSGYNYIVLNAQIKDIDKIMINAGSAPLHYEPYGYKIPISSANTITPVYLGEVETTRKIKKVVFVGDEDLTCPTTSYYRVPIGIAIHTEKGIYNNTTSEYNSHFIVNDSSESTTEYQYQYTSRLAAGGETIWFFIPKSFFSKEINASNCVSEFKEWLQQQHKNDTPVTVWYVLAEPKTGIVNEPLMKIGDYADSLSVDVELPLLQNTKNNIDVNTTLKPSSASFTYNKLSEYIGYNEINVDVSNTYTQSDEGKVVSNQTLVAQTSATYTKNGTYNTTTKNSVTVAVPPPVSSPSATLGVGRAKTCMRPFGDTWTAKTWNGLSSFNGGYVWTDGDNIYYSDGSSQYILDKATSTWITKTWNGLSSPEGHYIWTDGDNIYHSVGSSQYVLDKATSTWTKKTWNGLSSSDLVFFNGFAVWTDGDNIYYSWLNFSFSMHFVLDKATSTWTAKTWNGLSSFSGAYIWTDGDNIYYSTGSSQYILDKATSTWITKTWNGLSSFNGGYVWTDGDNIYYSIGSRQYVLTKSPYITRSVPSARPTKAITAT